ncbi:uncharacterized protein LOC128205710 [Mya arenaria]|uniref:uncharacterized protein LOC128205710 n=1 Tax=Mya arenaria TaxID=6604 RepID=UPI0022E97254|nr:uncharacterized protein LOC128205710 [Mya arenaria]
MLAGFETPLSVAVASVVVVVVLVVILAQCVCGKKKEVSIPNETAASPNPEQDVTLASPDQVKATLNGQTAVGLDPEMGITPLSSSVGSQNSNVHSRGNSLDLTKVDRRSGASTGSSPRPATSRELPDIPMSNGHKSLTQPAERHIQQADRGHHSYLPEVPPSGKSSTSTLESFPRPGTHSHTQLPEIPANGSSNKSPDMSSLRTSPRNPRAILSVDSVVPIRQKQLKENEKSGGNDDYDHLEESGKKKVRPRSDYDHVVLENGKEHIKHAKGKFNENDYAEVKADDYETVPSKVSVISISIHSTSQDKSPKKSQPNSSSHSPAQKTDSYDDPYNKIKETDPPYNKIKDNGTGSAAKGDDPPYNKIKDYPYNKIKVSLGDDPYNTVKEEDDLDPYNDILDETGNPRSAGRQKKSQNNSFKGAVFDPYNTVTIDEERNVSNQTDPYARVGDTEIDDPYNKVLDDGVGAAEGEVCPEYGEDDYATVNKLEEVEYAKVNKPTAQGRNTDPAKPGPIGATASSQVSNPVPPKLPPFTAREDLPSNQYSTVKKVRNISTISVGSGAGSSNTGRNSGAATSGTDSARNANLGQGHGNVVQGHIVTTQGASPSGQNPVSRGREHDFGIQNQTSHPVSLISSAQGLSSRTSEGQGQTSRDQNNEPTVPPEPPRDYDDSENGDGSLESDHYNTLALTRQGSTSDSGSQIGQKKEPPYNKLSVRESLASMNERAARNTYEYVSEVDNLYATVDGSSGDGVVKPKPGTSSQGPQTGEHYSEIDAPAPPSLDSLHETAKHEHRRKTDYYNLDKNSPNKGQGPTPGQGHTRTPSSDMTTSVESRVMSSSFEGHSMNSSFEGRVPIATQESDDLDFDPNYQSVSDDKISDVASEFDPNYETVEEARSRVKYEEINGARPKKPSRPHIYEVPDDKRKYEVVNERETVTKDGKTRAHVYEEVREPSEAGRLKHKVLSQHTYEEVPEVPEVKAQGHSGKKRAGKGAEVQSLVEGQKKKKGHERSGSGDLFSFAKRKSGDNDNKQKDKESKKKLDGKDGHKK